MSAPPLSSSSVSVNVLPPSAPLSPRRPRKEPESLEWKFVAGVRLIMTARLLVNLIVTFYLFNLYTHLSQTCTTVADDPSPPICGGNPDCDGSPCSPRTASSTVVAFGLAVGWFILTMPFLVTEFIMAVLIKINPAAPASSTPDCCERLVNVSPFGLFAAEETIRRRAHAAADAADPPCNRGCMALISAWHVITSILYIVLHSVCVNSWWYSGPAWFGWTCVGGIALNAVTVLLFCPWCV